MDNFKYGLYIWTICIYENYFNLPCTLMHSHTLGR